jgi:transketolase
MRNTFIDEIIKLARVNPQIALIVGDLGYSVIEPFAEEFPDRFMNAGVAEQNMTGLAAGMASEGYHVFTYSIANFPTFRCAEQIRNDVDYHNLPVTVVAVGGGVAYGNLGYSHHAVQDYALMRTMPNMLIASPGDPNEVRACLRYLVENPQPSYLRLGKNGEKIFHTEIPIIEPGKWLTISESKSPSGQSLLTTGAALQAILDINSYKAVYTLPLWGMSLKDLQAKQLAQTLPICIAEDHLIDGGFCSWMLESSIGTGFSNDQITCKTLSRDACGTVASSKTLWKLSGLAL